MSITHYQNGKSPNNGLFDLVAALQSLGDLPDIDQPVQPVKADRNNHHGYARVPLETTDLTGKARERNVSSSSSSTNEERIRIESKERQRPGGRLEHNRLEKDRRAQLKEHYQILQDQVPHLKNKKSSNQNILKGSQRFILVCEAREKKLQQIIQQEAGNKVTLTKKLEETVKKFEQQFDTSYNVFCKSTRLNVEDDGRDTDATESASEGEDYQNDIYENADTTKRKSKYSRKSPGPRTPSPSAFSGGCSSPRGIPHPVIQLVPPVNQRSLTEAAPVSPTPSTIPRATAKKLQAKLTTKYAASSSALAAITPFVIETTPTTIKIPASVLGTTSSYSRPLFQPRTVITSPAQAGGSFIQPRTIITSPHTSAVPISNAIPIPISIQGTRLLGGGGGGSAQSLLAPLATTSNTRSLVTPLFQQNIATPGHPTVVQGNPTTTLLSPVKRFNQVAAGSLLKDGMPRVIVGPGNEKIRLMSPQDMFIMPNVAAASQAQQQLGHAPPQQQQQQQRMVSQQRVVASVAAQQLQYEQRKWIGSPASS